MQQYRYLVTVKFTDTEDTKIYRIKTTLAGVEVRFKKHFVVGSAIIEDVRYDPNQD